MDSRRLEELTLNSSAPPGQLLYDGWLLRLAPGKAKRARSVNPIYPSRLPLEDKIAHCEALYAARGLPTLFRITPFSEPQDLDARLAHRGYDVFDPTAVESAQIDPARLGGGAHSLPLGEWIDAVARLRGSPLTDRDAHLARLQAMALPLRALAVHDAGRIVATGLTMVEGAWAGLFDIVTDEAARRRGHARTMVAALLRSAWELGARHAYLQVQAGNEAARPLYRQFGFQERYMYWYRARPGERH